MKEMILCTFQAAISVYVSGHCGAPHSRIRPEHPHMTLARSAFTVKALLGSEGLRTADRQHGHADSAAPTDLFYLL